MNCMYDAANAQLLLFAYGMNWNHELLQACHYEQKRNAAKLANIVIGHWQKELTSSLPC